MNIKNLIGIKPNHTVDTKVLVFIAGRGTSPLLSRCQNISHNKRHHRTERPITTIRIEAQTILTSQKKSTRDKKKFYLPLSLKVPLTLKKRF